ncbi:MAG: hypothetical protein LPK80_03555 [Bacteroidota bacterium]|nr:hypothetical protein [Bacteroidota bacterium]MDX5426942.1 hypothetical protein [Bacteroidota bacterium]MDX5447317.1 hypothetical protein [Bacteroidota bacterium]MDX5504930.1 hypothetical protein [Bacteroidota bacterium]
MKSKSKSSSPVVKPRLGGMITDQYCHVFHPLTSSDPRIRWYRINSYRITQ